MSYPDLTDDSASGTTTDLERLRASLRLVSLGIRANSTHTELKEVLAMLGLLESPLIDRPQRPYRPRPNRSKRSIL